jgi:hypothetical protein
MVLRGHERTRVIDRPTHSCETVLRSSCVDVRPERPAADSEKPAFSVHFDCVEVLREIDDESFGRRGASARVSTALDRELNVVCRRVFDLMSTKQA